MFVCPSVRMFRFASHLTGFDEIWYRCYTIGGYLKLVCFYFPTNMTDVRTYEVGETAAPLNIESLNCSLLRLEP
jgi:hypothetical protein